MKQQKSKAGIKHVLCPSDLSDRSQKALGFAVRLSETLNSSLTACHCARAGWFTQENRLPSKEQEKIKETIKECISECQSPASTLRWQSIVVENSFDAARDILTLAREADADLITMKARPGVLSAFRFGSIVERVLELAPCPVLLLPSNFLGERDPRTEPLDFERILFDYDFTLSQDQLFHVAVTLAADCDAELHMLSVLDPGKYASPGATSVGFSRTAVQSVMRGRIDRALRAEGKATMEVPTAVERGGHAETVLRYADANKIDLICTTLTPPNFYLEKLYSAYLGSLLKSANCPILVKRSNGAAMGSS